MAKTSITQAQIEAYERNFKLAAENASFGTYFDRNALTTSKGLRFVGFEIPGFHIPKTAREYFILLTTSSFRQKPSASILNQLAGTEKYNHNNVVSNMHCGALETRSVFEDANGLITSQMQCGAGRLRSFDDLFIIIRDRFKHFTVEQLLDIITETIAYCSTGIYFQILNYSRTACSTMSRLRLNPQGGYSLPISSNTPSTSPIYAFKEVHSTPEYFKSMKQFLNDQLQKNHSQSRTYAVALHDSAKNLIREAMSSFYQSVLSWQQLYNLPGVKKHNQIELKFINSLQVTLKYIK